MSHRSKANESNNTIGNGNKNSGERRILLWTLALIMAALVVGLGILFWIASSSITKSGPSGYAPEIVLPILLVLGVLVLLIALAVVAVVFKALKLDDKSQPLGLPQGTVRSIIALSLILIFIISSVFLFSRLDSGSTVVLQNVTYDQMALYSSRLVSFSPAKAALADAKTPQYDIVVRNDANLAAVDLSKQLMTMIGTLMVSVVGFYFGTSSALSGSLNKGQQDDGSPDARNNSDLAGSPTNGQPDEGAPKGQSGLPVAQPGPANAGTDRVIGPPFSI